MLSGQNAKLAAELYEAIQYFHHKGWSPATSTNYSVRTEKENEILISRSGVDKSRFELSDFILINSEGQILPVFDKPGVKSSAETDIHLEVYRRYPTVGCVLHTHSVLGTVLSRAFEKERQLVFEGWEILKGLDGNMTHELAEILPIVPNSQDMKDILRDMAPRFESKTHGFLIGGHGLYSWGKDIAAAKRHIETFEFLFECYFMMRRI